MEEKELIELYIQRNNLAKSSNMEEANKITEDINNELPTKLSKRGFKDSDGNVVEFEIVDINPHFYSIVEQGLPKPKQLKISGRKDPYARLLIRRKSFN